MLYNNIKKVMSNSNLINQNKKIAKNPNYNSNNTKSNPYSMSNETNLINENCNFNNAKTPKKTERTISHKIVIIGDANVGKTCLLTRFNHNKFDTTSPTIGAIHHIKSVDNLSLDIWDTAGQERFKSMIPMYYKGARAIIICFDITNPDSFEGAQLWHTEIFESVKKAIIVLCGTKKDLEEKRQIDYTEGKKFADRKGIKYFETSAKDDLNIQELFRFIAEQITLENLNKELEGVNSSSVNGPSYGKKLEKGSNSKNESRFSKFKSNCCSA